MQRIFKNPNLLFSEIDDNFLTCVNPNVQDGMKIITTTQKDVLDLILSGIEVDELCKISGFSKEEIHQFINIFKEKNIVNYTGQFEYTVKNNNPKNVNFWIHTTDDCNLRCGYCYISTKDTRKAMDDETIDNLCVSIIETVKKYNLVGVTLRLSGGEPTLVMNRWLQKLDLLECQLQEDNCKLRIVFLTNGTTINEDKIQKIKEHNLGIGISMDGLGKYHDKFRTFTTGKGSFDVVYKNIKKLLINGVKPNINCVVSNENMDGLPELTQFLTDTNIHFRYSFVQGEYINQEKLINILDECYNIIEKAVEKGYQFSNKHRLCDLKFLNPNHRVCWSGYSGGSIYIDGGVYFCQVHFGQDKEIGNINKNHDLLDIISRGNHYNTELPDDCKKCNYKYICSGGCPVERGEGKDPHCDVYKAMIPRIYKLIGKEKLLKIIKTQNVHSEIRNKY